MSDTAAGAWLFAVLGAFCLYAWALTRGERPARYGRSDATTRAMIDTSRTIGRGAGPAAIVFFAVAIVLTVIALLD